jgi:hypothetical protein
MSPNGRKRGSKIGAGLVTENIFKNDAASMPIESLIKISDESKAELEKIESKDFNIFNLQKSTNENELLVGVTFLLHKNDIFSKANISMQTFVKFIGKIQSGYKDITYHNKTHGADVALTSNYMIHAGGLKERQGGGVDPVEEAAMVIGGACHDHEHFGFNNVYLIETKHKIALLYNDLAVLENHHAASSF